MNTIESVLVELTPILSESLGVEPHEITPQAGFEQDLGGTSIDLLDVAFRCEKRFGIRLNFEELIDAKELETDEQGLLTAAALSRLKLRLPHLDYSDFEQHPQKSEIARTITVGALAEFVRRSLEK